MNRSEGKRLLVVSSKSIIESQWCTCGVSRKRSLWRPRSITSPSSCPSTRPVSSQPLRFSCTLAALHVRVESGGPLQEPVHTAALVRLEVQQRDVLKPSRVEHLRDG